MLGSDEEYVDTLARAHERHLSDGDPRRAARTAWWAGMQLMVSGEVGRGTGWLGRAQRLVDREPADCAERGYVVAHAPVAAPAPARQAA
jgi:hypothetical protein